jgi:hypothetical protein
MKRKRPSAEFVIESARTHTAPRAVSILAGNICLTNPPRRQMEKIALMGEGRVEAFAELARTRRAEIRECLKLVGELNRVLAEELERVEMLSQCPTRTHARLNPPIPGQ